MKFCEACGAIIIGNNCLNCYNNRFIGYNRSLILPRFFNPSVETQKKLRGLKSTDLISRNPTSTTEVVKKVQATPIISDNLPRKDRLSDALIHSSKSGGNVNPLHILLDDHPALKTRLNWEQNLNEDRKIMKSIRDYRTPQEINEGLHDEKQLVKKKSSNPQKLKV